MNNSTHAEPASTSTGRIASSGTQLVFSIRFTDGVQEDIEKLWLGDKETTRELKRRIRLLRPSVALRRLRIIYLGRVITDGTSLSPYVESLIRRQEGSQSFLSSERISAVGEALVNGAVRGAEGIAKSVRDGYGNYEAVIAGEPTSHRRSRSSTSSSATRLLVSPTDKDKGKGKALDSETDATPTAPLERVIWLQCAVGEEVAPEEAAALEATNKGAGPATGETASGEANPGSIAPLRGFDRLIEAGLSSGDIEEVRRQFYADREVNLQDDEDEHARALEEQWLDSLNSEGDELSSESTPPMQLFLRIRVLTSKIYYAKRVHYLVAGVCTGFFFPIAPLLFFRTDIFSQRTQMAILLGLVMNLAFGAVLRFA